MFIKSSFGGVRYRAIGLAMSVAVAGLAPSLFVGCAPYVTYPAEEAGRYAEGDVNAFPAPTVMRLGLNRVIALDRGEGRLRAGEPVLVNLPQGTSRRTAQNVAENIARQSEVETLLVGQPGFEDAEPYSVTRLWLRGDEARVDVVRPVAVGDEGQPRYQRTTVRLRSGVKPWQVESVVDWPRGIADEPELFGWPEPDRPDSAGDVDAPRTTPSSNVAR